MDEVKPVRLQLSRRKGFNLQALSRETNGLEAVVVSRPTKWGNPFSVTGNMTPGSMICAGQYVAVPTVEDAIECFRLMLADPRAPRGGQMRESMSELRGKNLACYCKVGSPCHADILLEIANQ